MKEKRNDMQDSWTREQTMIALNVYCKIPFKDSNKNHPLIVKYAKLIDRLPSALNMKIGNIGRLDSKLKERGIVGLKHGAKMEEEVWKEFREHPDRFAFESEQLIASYEKKSIEQSMQIDIDKHIVGEEREALVRQRVNQSFFRAAVLNAYQNKCCISGISCPELIDACHIVNWCDDTANRTNPENGLALNPLFHRAYDKFLLTITADYTIVVSDKMMDNVKENSFREYLKGIHHRKIQLPTHFLPKADFLDMHYQKFIDNQ